MLKNFKLSKGFTLVELLLVVGIIGIIAGISGDMFATVMRAYRKAEIFSYIERTGNNILTQIEQDLRSASLVTIDDVNNIVDISIPNSSGGVINKRYQFKKCGSGNDITTGISPSSLVSSTTQAYLGTTMYIDNISAVPFVYYFDTATGRPGMVVVAFTLFVGDSTSCTTPSNRFVESFFTTSVNLRGGIQ